MKRYQLISWMSYFIQAINQFINFFFFVSFSLTSNCTILCKNIRSLLRFLGEVFNFCPKTSTSCANVLQIVKKFRIQLMYIATRAVTRTLIGGGEIFVNWCYAQKNYFQIKFKFISLKRNLSDKTWSQFPY